MQNPYLLKLKCLSTKPFSKLLDVYCDILLRTQMCTTTISEFFHRILENTECGKCVRAGNCQFIHFLNTTKI